MTEDNETVCEVELRGGEEGEVKWAEFMPRMMIRVLLVEADDSTRQILTALLRKCNYKVAAIADGLQAWDILKKRHNCIDLVLTELDLPSISGYALLTLIMEHDRCKNIPVIMMSSQDSISMVLKCILKGAADFLIKPIRKNELKNLWRHVWRRLAINEGSDPQNVATEQDKVETANSEDNVSTSRKSSKSKATDSQDFSWMKHSEEIELSTKEMENRLKSGKIERELTLLTGAAEGKSIRLESGDLSINERGVSATIRDEEDGSCTGLATEDDSVSRTACKRKAHTDDPKPSDPCHEVVDLIGSMKRQKCVVAQTSYNGDFSNLNSEPELELSLRRVHDSETKEIEEKRTINHSNASPFSRYNSNKKSQTASPLSVSEVTEIKGEADLFACLNTFNSTEDDKSVKDVRSDPVSLPGVIYDGGVWTGYAPIHQPMFNSQTGPGAEVLEKSPNSSFHREESPFVTTTSLDFTTKTHNSTVEVDNSSNQPEGPEHELGNSSLQIVGPSSSSTPSNESADEKKTDALGSSSDNTANGPGLVEKSVVKEVKKDDSLNTFELDMLKRKARHQSAEREAALAKFRLKRKGRCYEKKVRYQSRKTLAEQRQRVKGQFVRQVPANTMLTTDEKT